MILVDVSPSAGRFTMVAPERGGERVRRGVAGAVGYLREVEVTGAQMVSSEGHSPLSEVLHRRLVEGLLECPGECRPGETAERGEFGHRPCAGGVSVDGSQRSVEAGVCRGVIPAWPFRVLAERSPYGVD